MALFKQFNDWVLASSSSKRADYLNQYHFKFSVDVANIDEQIEPQEQPQQLVARLARQKAEVVAKRHQSKVVIGADTIFNIKDKIMGKPQNKKDAFYMLKMLNGQTHWAHTAVYTLIPNKNPLQIISSTKLEFYKLDDNLLQAYVDTEEGLNSCGACHIDGQGAFLLKQLQGSWTAVTGFPIEEFIYQALEHKLLATL